MQVIYKNHRGNVESSDSSVCEVYAKYVLEHEKDHALAQGFSCHIIDDQETWQQTRLARINLEKYISQNQTFDTVLLLETTDNLFYKKLQSIYTDFCTSRNYYQHPGDIDFCVQDQALVYFENSEPVGYSKVRTYSQSVELSVFAFVKNNVQLNAKTSLEYELGYFKEQSYRYAYLGPSYESSSIYKSSISGFEWWTGESWSTNAHKFVERCTSD